jgi:hypothetical protein
MNHTPQAKMLSIQATGFPVPNLIILRRILNALTASDPPWFAVEPGPEDILLLYVRPETAERLTEIISDIMNPSTQQLESHFRSEAKRLLHDEGTLEIDDNAQVSISPEAQRGRGAYVQAWVWIDKHADYICERCDAQWFPFELLHTPSNQPRPPENIHPAPLSCPNCGSPCHPTRP